MSAQHSAGWDEIDGRRPPWRQLLPSQHLAATAARLPRKVAVQYGERAVTYEELDTMANRAANGLLALGARPGDVVGLSAHNRPETLACIYGLSRAGIAQLPLNPKNTADEIAFQVADARARFVVGPGAIPMSDVLDKGAESPPDVAIDEDAFFHVRFTSGTTGRPKAIATVQRAIALGHLNVALELGYATTDVALVSAPLAHAAFHIAAGHVIVGATLVLQDGFDPKSVWLECDRHGVTHTFLVPTMLAMSIDSPGSGASLRGFLVMASVFAPALKDRVAARFPHVQVFDAYGATELGLCTLLRPAHPASKRTSVGLPAFGYRVRVLDTEGNDKPPGEIGEIFVQGPSMSHSFPGSVRPPETAMRAGWLSVGDLGSLDEDGFLNIAERRSDLIISGGLNVYPAEVEDVLLRAPGVRDVVVIGLPEPTWGQQVVAVIVGDASVDELDAHCRQLLARYKVPRRYEFTDDLPKNPSGKVLRRVLRDRYAP